MEVTGLGRETARIELGPDPSYSDFDYSLSPDGARVAVVATTKPLRILDLRDGSIMEPEAEGWEQLSEEERGYALDEEHVAWSADGRSLYLTGMGVSGDHVLRRIDLDGKVKVLWNTPDHWVAYPCPSPDGSLVAFLSRHTEMDVWMIEDF